MTISEILEILRENARNEIDVEALESMARRAGFDDGEW